ncbi:hypothetical protein CPB86DRAFT_781384 [Serendipita vermifera]|nr:hypothetical protein CPB86DRAFT_781384 [Serendipita vermifera]
MTTSWLNGDSIPRVILMGATGSGKSTFITRIIGKNLGIIGHDLQSCTEYVQEFPIKYKGNDIILVDTPSFNHTDLPNETILKRIGDWLKQKYMNNQAIAGIIFLQKITDKYPSTNRNIKTLQAICGLHYAPQVALVTTHWTEGGARKGRVFHKGFEQRWCKSLHAKGARIFRMLDDTRYHAEPILDYILNVRDYRRVLLLQDEVGRQGKSVTNTTVGNELDGSVTDRIGQLEEEKIRLRKTLKSKVPDREMVKEQFGDVKDELRLLKPRRATLSGDVVGMIRYGVLRL